MVHDSVTKLPAFIRVIQAKPFNASDIKRNLRVEVHIFIPGKADIESIVFEDRSYLDGCLMHPVWGWFVT